ncbi:CAP domain-containing protein [Candidatus Cyanaurora vandensis]|uniref:CAP domain-containing protein n=1 Tax=Candidatus Cyanaurora vandensis TaxID=2714958 RepID=UPI00257F7903|nr:CAP domain-containing protein [Candidatus Cyanaurora vandensis]
MKKLVGLGLLLLTGCGMAPDFLIASESPSPQAPAPAPPSALVQMETTAHQRINAIRVEQGLKPLKLNAELTQVARAYSQKMAQRNFFAHTSPDGDTVADRVRGVGVAYRVVGENLFKGTNIPNPPQTAVEGWMQSPGHRRNILLTSYTEAGMGVWRTGNTYYFTQVFLRPLF